MDKGANKADTTDYFTPEAPEDSVSMMRFFPNPQNNLLATGGWDCKVRLWEIQYQQIIGMANSKDNVRSNLTYGEVLDNPILSIAWQGTNPAILAGCADGSIYLLDVQKKTKSLFGKHDAGCKDMIYNPQLNILISGGWDSNLKVWDFRASNAVVTRQESGKIFSMSNVNNLLVVAMNDRNLSYYNLTKLQQSGQLIPDVQCKSHLKYQTRRVCCFPEGNGYAIGSIEGRCAIKYVNFGVEPQINKESGASTTKDDFAFRCHRSVATSTPEVYPVNDIAFNPRYGTFVTVGGDGDYVIWDKDSRSRLKQGSLSTRSPITACDYSNNGDLLAYSSGYDWAKGVSGDGEFRPLVGIRVLTNEEKFKKTPK